MRLSEEQRRTFVSVDYRGDIYTFCPLFPFSLPSPMVLSTTFPFPCIHFFSHPFLFFHFLPSLHFLLSFPLYFLSFPYHLLSLPFYSLISSILILSFPLYFLSFPPLWYISLASCPIGMSVRGQDLLFWPAAAELRY